MGYPAEDIEISYITPLWRLLWTKMQDGWWPVLIQLLLYRIQFRSGSIHQTNRRKIIDRESPPVPPVRIRQHIYARYLLLRSIAGNRIEPQLLKCLQKTKCWPVAVRLGKFGREIRMLSNRICSKTTPTFHNQHITANDPLFRINDHSQTARPSTWWISYWTQTFRIWFSIQILALNVGTCRVTRIITSDTHCQIDYSTPLFFVP